MCATICMYRHKVLHFVYRVGRTKRKKLWVTGTMRRPVPLEHVLYYAGEFFPIARQDTLLTEVRGACDCAISSGHACPSSSTSFLATAILARACKEMCI